MAKMVSIPRKPATRRTRPRLVHQFLIVLTGTDPGVVPARFLIGATRIALGRRPARPGRIMENFYTELARR